MTDIEQPTVKVGQLVYHEHRRRWGQVVKDARQVQWQSGNPLQVMVFDTVIRGTIDWDLNDVSVIVAKGKIIWERHAAK